MVESQTQTPDKPKRGRPKGAKTRKPVHEGPHHKDDGRNLISRHGQTYEYVSDDEPDRFRIAPEEIPDGMTYCWIMQEILGQEEPGWWIKRMRTQWHPVEACRYPGRWMPKDYQGVIKVGGLVLCEKPTEFVERDKIKDKRSAAEQVWVRERAMQSGEAVASNVGFDSTSDKGRKANRVGKTYESIPVPPSNYERE
jgi:hypothetical protein